MKLEDGLIAADALTRRGSAAIIKNAGKIIAVITVIITVLLTFTDITFSSFSSAEFTSNLIIMMIASLLMYFSLEDSGEGLGRESQEYADCISKYNSARERIGGEDIQPLRAFCAEYTARELAYRRKCLLNNAGYSEEEYDEYNRGGSVSKEALAVFKRVKRMRTAHITPAFLLSGSEKSKRSELGDPTRFKLLKMSVKIIPTLVCMCVTVSMILTMKDGLSAADIIESLLKLSSLPIIGFRGYSAGYGYIKDCEIPQTLARSRWLKPRAFCHWIYTK